MYVAREKERERKSASEKKTPKSRMIIKGKINKRSMDKQILKNVWLDIKNNTANRTEMNMFKKYLYRPKCNGTKKANRFILRLKWCDVCVGPAHI